MDMRIASFDSCLRLKRQVVSKVTGYIIMDHYHSFLSPFIRRGLRVQLIELTCYFLSSPLISYGIQVITRSENLTSERFL